MNGSKATTADMGLQQFLVQGQRAISFDGFEGIITGAGNDVLRGSDGADYLSGATGSDVLTGGRGADILATSAYVIGDIDRFTDFDRSEGDRIDVSSIDAKIHPKHAPRDDDFDFIGTAEFDGLKGQLRYEVLDGSAFVTGDTNGDAEADFTIVIEGVDELRALDFIL